MTIQSTLLRKANIKRVFFFLFFFFFVSQNPPVHSFQQLTADESRVLLEVCGPFFCRDVTGYMRTSTHTHQINPPFQKQATKPEKKGFFASLFEPEPPKKQGAADTPAVMAPATTVADETASQKSVGSPLDKSTVSVRSQTPPMLDSSVLAVPASTIRAENDSASVDPQATEMPATAAATAAAAAAAAATTEQEEAATEPEAAVEEAAEEEAEPSATDGSNTVPAAAEGEADKPEADAAAESY